MKSVLKPKYELITSHTARRSFATNLALRGVSETVIQRFLGHTNIKQTSKYIVCSADDVLDRMENVEFFK